MRRPRSTFQMFLRAGGVVVTLALGALAAAAQDASPEEPLLRYSTYLGGDGPDVVRGAAFGPDSALWVLATSGSGDFPGAPRPAGAPERGTVLLRVDPSSRTVLSATWHEVEAEFFAFDDDGNGYLAGGSGDAFVARLLPDGNGIAWVTTFGGSSSEMVAGLCVTDDGDPVVAGTTWSDDFPLVAPLRTAKGGTRDAFVARVHADGSGLAFSTYLGGSDLDDGEAVAIAPDGAILVAGSTQSADFATERLFGQAGEGFEGFLAEIDSAGTELRRVFRIGETLVAEVRADAPDSFLLLGQTTDLLPVTQAPNGPPPDDVSDAVVLRLDAETWAVRGGTYVGGSDREYYLSMDIAPDGTLWVAGSTTSSDLPVPGAARPLLGSNEDAFVAAFDASDFSQRFGTFLGGNHRELGYAVAAAPDGTAWLGGATASTNFPTVRALQTALAGEYYDLFLAQISAGDPLGRPAAPTDIAASTTDANAVRVTWTAGDGLATGFGIDRREEGAPGFERVAVVAASAREWTDTTVLPDRTYTYAVQAFSATGGSAPSAAVEAVAPPSLRVGLTTGRHRVRTTLFVPMSTLRLRGLLITPTGQPVDLTTARERGMEFVFESTYPYPPLVIPADDAGWRARRRGGLRRSGYGVRLDVDVDGRFDLQVVEMSRLGLETKRPMRIRITIGDDTGSTSPTWRRSGRNGIRIVRMPLIYFPEHFINLPR